MTRIFISHSHSDQAIAFRLVNFLLAALRVEEEEILCTSNPNQGLTYSSHSITDQLKHKLKTSEAIIILITLDSLHSAWIPFEAGSFWTTDKPVIPILGKGLTQNNLPGPLKSFLSIAMDTPDFTDKLNSAINQLADKLQIEQRFTTRRNHTLQEFFQHLKDWKSKYPNSNRSQQQQIEELTRQLRELQSFHDKQLAEIETTSQQEKEQIKQSYLTQIQELQQSNQDQQQLEKILTSQIQELEQQLQQAQSFLIAQQQVEQFLKSKIQQLEQLQPTTIVSEIVSKTEEVELRSARGVDYTKLYDLLKQKQWQEADEETAKLMLQAANRENSDLRIYDIENFPCEDLRTINNLWLQHSNSKFGFSVQDDIYVGLGASRESESQVWEQFGYLVGWRRGKHWREYEELTFDLNLAPQGHLPTVWMNLSAQNRTSFFFLLSFNL